MPLPPINVRTSRFCVRSYILTYRSLSAARKYSVVEIPSAPERNRVCIWFFIESKDSDFAFSDSVSTVNGVEEAQIKDGALVEGSDRFLMAGSERAIVLTGWFAFRSHCTRVESPPILQASLL